MLCIVCQVLLLDCITHYAIIALPGMIAHKLCFWFCSVWNVGMCEENVTSQHIRHNKKLQNCYDVTKVLHKTHLPTLNHKI